MRCISNGNPVLGGEKGDCELAAFRKARLGCSGQLALHRGQRTTPFPSPRDKKVAGEPILFGRQHEHKEQQGQPRNHVFMEGIERFSQKVAEGYDYENKTKRDKCFANAQTDNQ